MRKSPDAFRTISEVAEDLDLPQHVLRFWETRFSQIKPMKRGGGRRYYRPDDVDLLRGIRHLLYDEGYTIKGVQRILKEQGVRHVIDSVLENPEAAYAADGTVTGAPATTARPDNTNTIEPNQLEVQRPPLVMPDTPPNAHPPQPAPAMTPQPAAPQARPAPVQPQMAPQQPPQPQQNPQQHPVAQHPASAQQMLSQAARRVETGTAATAYAYPQEMVPEQPAPQVHPSAPIVDPAIAAQHGAQAVSPVQTPSPEAYHPHPPQHMPLDASQAAPAVPVAEMPAPAQPTPKDLTDGDPKFLRGESASVSIEDGRARLLEEEQRTGLFSRFRGRSDSGQQVQADGQKIARDDVRRLQSTLFELLECKRILDQARND